MMKSMLLAYRYTHAIYIDIYMYVYIKNLGIIFKFVLTSFLSSLRMCWKSISILILMNSLFG